MEDPATSFGLIDLMHLGQAESVAACLLETEAGPVLIDPGPSSTIPALRKGLAARGREVTDLHALLLTHIHLDHAGATGTLARECPGLTVFVHQSGAPHVADPSKLLASATRLYGSRMDELWGEVAAVPAERIRALTGEERLRFGRRTFEVAYTPGHAWHHVSYFEPATGSAFVGDTAGLRTPGLPCVLPVTPPPDYDLEAWLASIDRILEWRPDRIVLTHYGPSDDPAGHLEELRAGLIEWTRYARESLGAEGSDAERLARFVASLEGWIVGRTRSDRASRYLAGAGPDACWHGLRRYLQRKAASTTV